MTKYYNSAKKGRPVDGWILPFDHAASVARIAKRAKMKAKNESQKGDVDLATGVNPNVCPFPGCKGRGSTSKGTMTHRALSKCPLARAARKNGGVLPTEMLREEHLVNGNIAWSVLFLARTREGGGGECERVRERDARGVHPLSQLAATLQQWCLDNPRSDVCRVLLFLVRLTPTCMYVYLQLTCAWMPALAIFPTNTPTSFLLPAWSPPLFPTPTTAPH